MLVNVETVKGAISFQMDKAKTDYIQFKPPVLLLFDVSCATLPGIKLDVPQRTYGTQES